MIWKISANIQSFFHKCKRDNINAYSAQTAFFMILSAIPFLMMFSALMKYTPVTEGMILQLVNKTMPEYIAPFLVSVINEVYTKSIGIVSVTAVVAIWSAAKGVQYMTDGLNVVNDIEETRKLVCASFLGNHLYSCICNCHYFNVDVSGFWEIIAGIDCGKFSLDGICS